MPIPMYGNRPRQTSTTTGTGTYSLAAVEPGHQRLAAAVGAVAVRYELPGGSAGPWEGVRALVTDTRGQWEIITGTLTQGTGGAPDTLTRDVIESSRGVGVAIDWKSGTRRIAVIVDADAMTAIEVYQDLLQRRNRPRAYTPPAGFGWNPPCTIFRTMDGRVGTDLDIRKYFYHGAGKEYFIDPVNGASGNDGLTMATAKSNLTQVVALGDYDIITYAPGALTNRETHGSIEITRSCTIRCVDGRAMISWRTGPASTWSVHSGDIYKAARSAVRVVFDATVQDEYGDYLRLTNFASLAALEGTSDPGWYSDGTDVYVRRPDGAEPTWITTAVILADAGASSRVLRFAGAITVYLENIDVEGGNVGLYFTASGVAGARFYSNNCRFLRCGSGNGLGIVDVELSILKSTLGAQCHNDGLNYTPSGSVLMHILEVDCIGRRNGLSQTSSSSQNGSTCHGMHRVVRVNGLYYGNFGPNMVDVETSPDGRTWAIGCGMWDSVGNDTQNANAYMDAVTAWLEDCAMYGATYDVAISGSGTVFTRLCDRNREAVLVGSGSTLDTF